MLIIPWLLFSCQPKAEQQTLVPSTYVLILTDTTESVTTWLTEYRRTQSVNTKVVVSGYPAETQAEVMARLPWLLQPGVDTLFIDQHFIDGGEEICDSLATWSPSTICQVK